MLHYTGWKYSVFHPSCLFFSYISAIVWSPGLLGFAYVKPFTLGLVIFTKLQADTLWRIRIPIYRVLFNENLPRVPSSRDLMKCNVVCDDPIIKRKMFSCGHLCIDMFSWGKLSCIWNFVSFIMFAGRSTQNVLVCFLILAFIEFLWFLLPEVCKIILIFLLVLLWIPTWIPQHLIILISHVNHCFLQLSFKESIRKIMLKLCRKPSPKWRTIFSLADKIATLQLL